MYINYYKTYIQTIHNSVWADIWRSFFIDYDDRRSVDILRDWSASCAYFVSNILKQFNMMPTSHANVDTTREVMIKNWWTELDLNTNSNDIPVWAVLFWKEKKWSDVYDIYDRDNSKHKHIWFYIWDKQAISNQSESFYTTWGKLWTPQIHPRDFNWDREIEYIFVYPWDISWSDFIKSDYINICKNQQFEIPLIPQTKKTIEDPKHGLSSDDILFGLWDDMKIGRLCGLSCILMSINYLTKKALIYSNIINYRHQEYTFYNPKTWSNETRSIYNTQIGGRNHGGLIKIANEHDLKGEILTFDRIKSELLTHIAQAIDQDYILLCSVSLWFDTTKAPWWHLVLIRGLDRNWCDYNIIVNDPSNPNRGAPISVPIDIFVSCFSGKAIKISR